MQTRPRTTQPRTASRAARSLWVWSALLFSLAGCSGANPPSNLVRDLEPEPQHAQLGAYTGDEERFLYVERDSDPAWVYLWRYERGFVMHIEVVDGPITVDFGKIVLTQNGYDHDLATYDAATPVTAGWPNTPPRYELARGEHEALIEFAKLPSSTFCSCRSFEFTWGPYRFRF